MLAALPAQRWCLLHHRSWRAMATSANACSAVVLGRLAVSTEFRGRGLGEILLIDALHRSLDSNKQIASAGVIVDAKDEPAAGFCRRYGFVELPKIEKRLFLPMGTVEQLFRKGR